jgi:single-stranded DNA-specific DHH superfamily exonuclease
VFAFVDTDDGVSKISARLIGLEEAPYSLNDVISKVASDLGGEGGGHMFAAGASIPKGCEQMFINRMEDILKQFNGHAAGTKHASEAAKPQKGETLNNRDTENVKSEVNVGGSIETDEQTEEIGHTSSSKKMEGKGLVRYFNS